MKKTIRYMITLCLLAALLMPSTAFAATGNQCTGKTVLSLNDINCTQLSKICGQFDLSKVNCSSKAKLDDLMKALNQKRSAKVNSLCAKAAANCADPAKAACKINGTANTSCRAKAKAPAPTTVEKPATTAPVQKPATTTAPVQKPTTTAPVQKPATTAAPAAKPAPTGTAAPASENQSISGTQEAQVVDLVNQERAANGLPALKYNSSLSKVAEAKAADMRDKGYFSHTSPTYGSPFDMMKSFGISYRAAGENIAKGYKTPDSVMNGWMNSEGHRANILNSNFTEIGVGYVTDSNGTGYWVQMFIRP